MEQTLLEIELALRYMFWVFIVVTAIFAIDRIYRWVVENKLVENKRKKYVYHTLVMKQIKQNALDRQLNRWSDSGYAIEKIIKFEIYGGTFTNDNSIAIPKMPNKVDVTNANVDCVILLKKQIGYKIKLI